MLRIQTFITAIKIGRDVHKGRSKTLLADTLPHRNRTHKNIVTSLTIRSETLTSSMLY